MKSISLEFYNDPGHGWCKVKRNLLTKLGIADKISTYSYQRKDYVYLEEDCDAAKLIQALRLANIEVVIKEKHTNKQSKIRSYNRYVNENLAQVF